MIQRRIGPINKDRGGSSAAAAVAEEGEYALFRWIVTLSSLRFEILVLQE